MDSIFNRLLDLTDHYSQSLFSTIAIDIFKHHEIISITAINIFEQQSINSTMANDFLITSRKIGDQVPYPYVSTWNISCLVAMDFSPVEFTILVAISLNAILASTMVREISLRFSRQILSLPPFRERDNTPPLWIRYLLSFIGLVKHSAKIFTTDGQKDNIEFNREAIISRSLP